VKDWLNPHVVKVVPIRRTSPSIFSISIPFPRDLQIDRLESNPLVRRPLPKESSNISVSMYTRPFLLRFTKMKPTLWKNLKN
jgi:hypothetical protein